MTKQYHNRQTERGRERWDVDRLIALSQGLPVEAVPLSAIAEYEEVYWFDRDHPPTCRVVVEHARRIEAVDLAHPIILSASGLVMDGMHRVAKAHMTGRETIDAVRFDVDPEPDEVESATPGSAPIDPGRRASS